jgi:hypothetical protein
MAAARPLPYELLFQRFEAQQAAPLQKPNYKTNLSGFFCLLIINNLRHRKLA